MANIFGVNTNEAVNAHVGPALLFYAPYGTTFPTDIGDVVNLTGSSQWQPKSGWTCLGATKTGVKIERGFTKVDRTSDHSFGPYDHRPNHWTATVTTELLETTPTGLQIAWVGGQITTGQTGVHTTVTAAAAAGASSVTVNSTSSISSGDVVIVGGDATQEWHTVTVASGTTLTFGGETLLYAQASGQPVVRPGKQSLSFGHPRSVPNRVLAAIAPLVTISATDKANIDLIRMWAFRRVELGEGNKTMTLSQDNDWTLQVNFQCYRDNSSALGTTDETADVYKVFDLTL